MNTILNFVNNRSGFKICILVALAFFSRGAFSQIVSPITSSSSGAYCPSVNYTFQIATSDCQFKDWSYSGNWVITGVGGGEDLGGGKFSQTITAKILSSGTVTATFDVNCTDPNAPLIKKSTLPIVLRTVNSATISASANQVNYGDQVTLNATGATSATWTGAGLSSSSGISVTATPPAGTTSYQGSWVWTDGICTNTGTGTVNVTVTLPPLDAGSDRTYCKEQGTVDLATWGLNGTEGSWSGPAGSIVNGFVVLSTLSTTQANSFTFTRTADQATDNISVFVIDPVAGAITISPTSSCETATGSLTLDGTTDPIQYWEYSTTNGSSWFTVMDNNNQPVKDKTIPYNTSAKILYRAAVKRDDCNTIAISAIVSVEPSTTAKGFVSADAPFQVACHDVTGALKLNGAKGQKFTWESKGASQTLWTKYPTTTTPDNLPFAITETTSFHVLIEATGCDPVVTDDYVVNAETQPGIVHNLNGNTRFCGEADVTVSSEGATGSIINWWHSTDKINWVVIPESDNKYSITHHTKERVNYYRVQVKLGTCADAFAISDQVFIDSPVVPGHVEFTEAGPATTDANGALNFNVQFDLKESAGNIDFWQLQKLSNQNQYDQVDNHTTSITIPVKETTKVQAQLSDEVCPALLSGPAIFIVNLPFLGTQDVFGYLVVNQYVGKSYNISTPQGMSLADGFSFIANSEQSFAVLMDKNYSIPPAEQNYSLNETITQEGVTDEGDIYFLKATQRVSAYSFADGLGRPLQIVQRSGSPDEKDMVKAIAYDESGRPSVDYLPYVTSGSEGIYQKDAVANQASFYLQPPNKVAGSNYPYAVRVYEESPLSRVTEQGSVGSDWQPGSGHTVKFNYLSNAANEVKRWKIDDDGLPIQDGYYPAGEMIVGVTISAHNQEIKKYADKQGLAILSRVQNGTQWVDTYSIYDDFNLLRFVIQPEGVAQISASPTQEFLDKWAFQYKYDERKRVIESKVPGADWTYTVYDNKDKRVMTQDGILRSKNQWAFVKYDALQRPVMTGIYTHDSALSQTEMALLIASVNFTESYTGTGDAMGYTNTPIGTGTIKLLTVQYYDDYKFKNDIFGPGFDYDKDALAGLAAESFARVRGLSTGRQVRVLNADQSEQWLKKVTYYDKRYRPIQSVAQNHLGGVDRGSQVYSFIGQPIKRKKTHTKDSKTITIVEEFEYDHTGRLKAQYHQVNDQPKVLLKTHSYNAVGQLVEKNLHGSQPGANDFLQSIDYRYNIKGQLTSINNGQLTMDNGLTNDDENDFFGMELKYNNPTLDGSTAQFNGNISEAHWNSKVGNAHAYSYSYDKQERLLTARHFDKTNPEANGKFSESVTLYTLNGSIKNLSRNGELKGLAIVNKLPKVTRVAQPMDLLEYSYADGNLLSKVEDNSGNAQGFDNGKNEDTEYTYNANGSMKADLNKGISNISYNVLNKPEEMELKDGKRMVYAYDASGNKLSQQLFEGTTLKSTINYAGSFVYHSDTLKFFSSPEGRIVVDGDKFEYQYAIADHQGNTRVVFTSAQQKAKSTLANFEGDADDKSSQFVNVKAIPNGSANTTHDGNYVVRLNQDEPVGPGLSKRVYPGDKVDMEAYSYYEATDGYGTHNASLTGLITSVAGIFGGVSGAPELSGAKYAGVNNALSVFGTGPNQGDGAPAAFLNYILFDQSYNVLDAGWQVVTASSTSKERVSIPAITVKEAGYIFVYLSYDNESDNPVYFDDFKVTITPTNIIQSNDYYAFGLQTSSSWTREDSENNFLYNGGSEINNATGLYDTFFRNYDPVLGRFTQVDPLALAYGNQTPYQYAANNPQLFNDPLGDKIMTITDELAYFTAQFNAGNSNPDGKGFGGGATELEGFYQRLNAQNYRMTYNGWAPGSSLDKQDAKERAARARPPLFTTWAQVFMYVDLRLNGFNRTQQSGSNPQDDDPNAWVPASVAKAFFGEQMSKYGDKITWEVKNMLVDGTTRRLDNGKIHIQIAVRAILDPTHAYLTIGHELIHAEDYLNGNYERWMTSLGASGFQGDFLKDVVGMAMEYHAYQWDASMEGQFKVDFGAQSEMKSLTEQMNEYGIMWLFNK